MRNPIIADQLVQVLRQAGVERIYRVVGDSLNPVVDAVRRTGGIGWAGVRNEEVVAFAAAAETKKGIVVPSESQVHASAARLNAARTVTVFCGAGVQGAHDEVMAPGAALVRCGP
jgi:thiamine pyrophosphate-dependent acetolactate synthase large subunit-like protein